MRSRAIVGATLVLSVAGGCTSAPPPSLDSPDARTSVEDRLDAAGPGTQSQPLPTRGGEQDPDGGIEDDSTTDDGCVYQPTPEPETSELDGVTDDGLKESMAAAYEEVRPDLTFNEGLRPGWLDPLYTGPPPDRFDATIGETVYSGNFEVLATGWQEFETFKDAFDQCVSAQGLFVAVHVEATNIGAGDDFYRDAHQYLVDIDGNRYGVSPLDGMYGDSAPIAFVAGEAGTHTILFDIPVGTTPTALDTAWDAAGGVEYRLIELK